MITLSVSDLVIIRMNKASITLNINNEPVYITRRVFNKLILQGNLRGEIESHCGRNGQSYQWFAALSIF